MAVLTKANLDRELIYVRYFPNRLMRLNKIQLTSLRNICSLELVMKRLATATLVLGIVLSQSATIFAQDNNFNPNNDQTSTNSNFLLKTLPPQSQLAKPPQPSGSALPYVKPGSALPQNEVEFEARITQMRQEFLHKQEMEKTQEASREAELRVKFQVFRDQQKAQLAQKINSSLSQVNTNVTNELNKALTVMTNYLNRMDSFVAREASNSAVDTTDASSAISNARAAVASAQTAVNAQASKSYSISAPDETTIKSQMQSLRDQLKSDLENTRNSVKSAKDAVIAAAKATAALKGATNGK